MDNDKENYLRCVIFKYHVVGYSISGIKYENIYSVLRYEVNIPLHELRTFSAQSKVK